MEQLRSKAEEAANAYISQNISVLSIVSLLQDKLNEQQYMENIKICPSYSAIKLEYENGMLTFRYNIIDLLADEFKDANVCLSDASMEYVKEKIKTMIYTRITDGFFRPNNDNKVRDINEQLTPILYKSIKNCIDKQSDIPNYINVYGAFHRLRNSVYQNISFIKEGFETLILMIHIHDHDSGKEYAVPVVYSNAKNELFLIINKDEDLSFYDKYELSNIVEELFLINCNFIYADEYIKDDSILGDINKYDIENPEYNIVRLIIAAACLMFYEPDNIKSLLSDDINSNNLKSAYNILNHYAKNPVEKNKFDAANVFIMILVVMIQTMIINKQREDSGRRGYISSITPFDYI